MIRPTVVNFLDEMMRGRNSLRVEDIAIPEGFAPCPLGDLTLRRSADYVLLAVRTGQDWLFNPDVDFVLQAGQAIIVMASPSGRIELERVLLAQ